MLENANGAVDAILDEVLGRQSPSWIKRTALRLKAERSGEDFAEMLSQATKRTIRDGVMAPEITALAMREGEVALEEIMADARELEAGAAESGPDERTMDLADLINNHARVIAAPAVLASVVARLVMDRVRAEPPRVDKLVDAWAVALADWADEVDGMGCTCGTCPNGATVLLAIQDRRMSWPQGLEPVFA